MQIDINGVKITLTKEQLLEISTQVFRESDKPIRYTLSDLTSYKNALIILGQVPSTNIVSVATHLKTIIKAANYIDNDYKVYIPDFEDSSHKYIARFQKSGFGGWVFCGCSYPCYSSDGRVGLYYKKEDTAITIAKRFTDLYNMYID